MSKTVAILTGGGDCPGLNAVIRGVVRSAILQYGWRVIGIRDGFDGLVNGPDVMTLDLNSVRGILPRGGTILGTSNRGNPFAYPVERSGRMVLEDVSARVLENFKAIGADALIVVGGDGSLKIAAQFGLLGMPVVGVPKTIDNDLSSTDVTFGFSTAVEIVTDALDRLHSTAESHHRVMLVEVMGRDAGWIALHAGIAGSADVILIPEIPFQLEEVCAAIRRRRETGSRFSIVVVAEGAKTASGEKVVQVGAKENLGVERLGGIAHSLAHNIEACSGMEVRVVVLGHVQRGGTPCAFDRILSSRFGVKAMELVANGGFSRMVALRGSSLVAVPIADAVGQLNLVDTAGELVRTAESLGIMLGYQKVLDASGLKQ